MRDEVEKDPDAFDEYLDVLDLAAGMDMEVVNFEVIFPDEIKDKFDLVDGDSEFGFVMTGRDLEVAAGHNVGAEPYPNGVGRAKSLGRIFPNSTGCRY